VLEQSATNISTKSVACIQT